MKVWQKCLELGKRRYQYNLLFNSRASRIGNTERGISLRGNILCAKNITFVLLLYHISHKLKIKWPQKKINS